MSLNSILPRAFYARLVFCITSIIASSAAITPAAAADGKGTVILATTLHTQKCPLLSVRLATPNGTGAYAIGDGYSLRKLTSVKDEPSLLMLPAGRYAIVALHCQIGAHHNSYNSPIAKRTNVFTSDGNIVEKPIATFSVGSGEVVDIGYLEMLNGPTKSGNFFTPRQKTFQTVARRMPAEYLRYLAQNKPEIYKARIVRTMSVPKSR